VVGNVPQRPIKRLKLPARVHLRNESFVSAPQLKRDPLGGNMAKRSLVLAAVLGVVLPQLLVTQQGAPPPDRTVGMDSAAWACLERAMQPRFAEARRTFPAARSRFAAGLLANHIFSVTTRLRDSTGLREQVFVIVDSLHADTAYGRIASEIEGVTGYRRGQAQVVPMSEVLDWTIVRPNGSEEGNFIGKYLDSLHVGLQQGGIPKPC